MDHRTDIEQVSDRLARVTLSIRFERLGQRWSDPYPIGTVRCVGSGRFGVVYYADTNQGERLGSYRRQEDAVTALCHHALEGFTDTDPDKC